MNNNRKKDGKTDYKRQKTSKYKDKKKEIGINYTEMLQLQGLILCKYCDNPYPYHLDNCPTCNIETTLNL
jgi:hypothetical protein